MKALKERVWMWVGAIASISSILGIILTFMADSGAVILSLSFFCLALLAVLIGVFVTMSKMLRQNHVNEYEKISSFYEYRSDDGVRSTFEVYRLIQSKRALLTQIEYKFKWSGSIPPRISSNSQTIDQPVFSNSSTEWDKCVIHFPEALTYNESTVVHIRCENDDHDGKAESYISTKLDSPIKIMHFKVLLAYKPDGYRKAAVFERKLIGSDVEDKWHYLEEVSFDPEYRQYQLVVVSPPPGYVYRLRWEKWD